MPNLSPDELLTTTRTVRRRLDLHRPVPLDLVKECIEVALQAPSGSNAERWAWVVVTDPDKRAAIGELYRRAWDAYLDSPWSAARLFTDDPVRSAVQRRVSASSAVLAERMGRVPIMVIPCIQVVGGDFAQGTQAGLWASLLPAAWSYILAARARGLGTAWTSLHLNYEAEVATLLGIPGDMRQGALIPTAYYTGERFSRAPRRPLDEVLHVDAW
jgi:nitroreductase